MFSLFPVLGITQGFIPIAGFNYGAKNKKRVEPKISKIISSKLLLPTRSLIKIIDPIEIVDDASKYPNQLGSRTSFKV